MQVLIWFSYPLVFVDASEILVMADDVVTPLNPPIAAIKQEELEEVSLDECFSMAARRRTVQASDAHSS
jgi:hypothetical protein